MVVCSYCGGAGCKVCIAAQLKQQEQGGSKKKYKNKEIVVDGFKFDSKAESEFYELLKIKKAAGEIVDFTLQPKFEIIPGFMFEKKKIRATHYVADFEVTHVGGHVEIVDVKTPATITPLFKVKKKLFMLQYGADISIMIKCPSKYGQGFVTLEQFQELEKREKGVVRRGKGSKTTKTKPNQTKKRRTKGVKS